MRYVIFEDSLSGHCCFGYSIVDTTQGDKTDYKLHKGLNIIEVFDEDKAIEVCKALNFVEHGYKCYTMYHDDKWISGEDGNFDYKEWKVKQSLVSEFTMLAKVEKEKQELEKKKREEAKLNRELKEILSCCNSISLTNLKTKFSE